MVSDVLLSFGLSIIRFIFNAVEFFVVPTDIVEPLFDILVYGTWVVGYDVVILCTSCITFWIGVRLSTGLAVWIYDHLPFV